MQQKPKGYPQHPKTIGQELRKHRMDLGLFQKNVAKLIGVSTDSVTNWELGRTTPDKRFLEKCQLFLKSKPA